MLLRMVETQRWNDEIIMFLIEGNGWLLKRRAENCDEFYKQFTESFERSGTVGNGETLRYFMAGRPKTLSIRSWVQWRAVYMSCFIPGKSIHDNLQFIYYTVQRVWNISGKHRSLVHLDEYKSFHKVDYRYRVAVLREAEFGLTFCARIAALYSYIEPIALVNRLFSKLFKIERSVDQRCPLTLLLYLWTLDLLRILEAVVGLPHN